MRYFSKISHKTWLSVFIMGKPAVETIAGINDDNMKIEVIYSRMTRYNL
jgi:hypothetical protein